MNRVASLLIVGVTVFGFALTVRATNLVTNGSFEIPATASSTTVAAGSPALAGWQISGTSGIDLVRTLWQPSDALQSISLNWTSPSTLTQTIATVPGQHYQLSFDMAAEPNGGLPVRTMNVLWDGNLAEAASFSYTGQPPNAMGWQSHTDAVVGGVGGTDTLQFVSTTAGGFGPALDNVALNGVPEPGAMTLALLAIAVSGCCRLCGRQRSPCRE
jgi:choice-of-anchor C domain-containing protein